MKNEKTYYVVDTMWLNEEFSGTYTECKEYYENSSSAHIVICDEADRNFYLEEGDYGNEAE